jgi:ribosome-associated heat shock protein Hsp15
VALGGALLQDALARRGGHRRRPRLGNEERAKAAKSLRVGDVVVVRKPPFDHTVVVKGLSEQRGSATIAAALFEETAESRRAPHGAGPRK